MLSGLLDYLMQFLGSLEEMAKGWACWLLNYLVGFVKPHIDDVTNLIPQSWCDSGVFSTARDWAFIVDDWLPVHEAVGYAATLLGIFLAVWIVKMIWQKVL